MNPNESRSQDRRQGRAPRRNQRGNGSARQRRGPREERGPALPVKRTLWQKILAFFTGGARKAPSKATREAQAQRREPRQPERVEVTSPKLFVGNLSYRVSDSDLFDLFKTVGEVENAEVVLDRQTDESKGFGFVTMQSVALAKRAVEKLHEQDFMGRKLVVSGSKSESRRNF